MSKLDLASRVPANWNRSAVTDIVRAITTQVNNVSEGKISGRYASMGSIPSGSAKAYSVGDIVWNTNPTVLGSVVAGVATDYVLFGWINTVAGSPGTFKELRVPVGSGSGFPAFSQITNSLSGDVSLSNTAQYFDGPSVSQGSTGTWFVCGTVTVTDTGGASEFKAKLWDGTTVIASADTVNHSAGSHNSISLSGFISSPQGNLRISVLDVTATTGVIRANRSGNSKDSTITAIRIA